MKTIKNSALLTVKGDELKQPDGDGGERAITILDSVVQHVCMIEDVGPGAKKVRKLAMKVCDLDEECDSFDLEDAEFELARKSIRPTQGKRLFSAFFYAQLEEAFDAAEAEANEEAAKQAEKNKQAKKKKATAEE